MKVRWAFLLAILWVVSLVSADVWCILELKVADAHLKAVLDEVFAAPVSIGKLTLSPTLDLVATDILLNRPDDPSKKYATIDEVRVTPDWAELLTHFRLQVKDIEVDNPTLVLKWHERDRTFDMPSPLRQDLEARTKEIGELPAITLHGLTLALENPPDIVKHKQNFMFDKLSLILAPEGSERWLYRFEVDVNHAILGHMRGVGRFSRNEVDVELTRNGLMVTHELLEVLTPDVRDLLENLSVEGGLRLTARVGPVENGAEAFSAAVDCQGMTIHVREWPQALTKIQGRLEYFNGKLTTDVLTAEFERAPLTMRGFLDLSGAGRVVDVSGEIIGLGISNQLAARIRKLPGPCPTVADQIEAWDPDGYANIKFRLLEERDEKQVIGPLHPSFEVEFKGATSMRYVGHVGKDGLRHGFAYPIGDLRGVIKFTDEAASFDRLTAMNGSLAVEAHGRITYEQGGDETYDVDVAARGLRLDEKVGAALNGSARELFNGLDADGSADLSVAIKRQKGEAPGPRVDITVDLQGVGLRTRAFPLDLADARGRLVITDPGPIVIEKITAKRRGGSLGLRGVVPVDRRNAARFEMDFDFEKFPIDPALTAALKEVAPDAAETLVKLNPTGRIDGTVHLALEPDGSQKDLHGALRFDNMTLAPEDPSIRIDDLAGSLTLSREAVTVNPGTTASIAGERFAIKGAVKSTGVLDLSIEAANFQVDRELVADIEPLVPSIRRLETRPEITGPMSMNLHVVGPATDPQYTLEADFHGVDVAFGAIPGCDCHEVRGHVSMSLLGEVKLTGLSMRIPVPTNPPGVSNPPGASEAPRPVITFELAEGTWEPPAKTAPKYPKGRLTLKACSARGIEITPGAISLLPVDAELKTRFTNMAISGVLDVVVETMKWDGTQFTISGTGSRFAASRLSFGAERPILAESFTIGALTATAGGGLFEMHGKFLIDNGRFLDIPVPKCVGKIDADVAGVRFEKLNGEILGYDRTQAQVVPLGKINPETSRFEVFFADGSFDTHLVLQDVNLPAAIRALGGTPGQLAGMLRCTIDTLRGTLGDTGSLKGTGDCSIRARNVVSLPVFYKMFNSLDVLSIFDKKTDPWTKIDAEFAVGDRVLRMPKIKIDAPDIMLQGNGQLTFAGHVKADLKTNQGMTLSPIGWVTRMISHAVFAGVRIEGPMSDPRVDAYGMGGG